MLGDCPDGVGELEYLHIRDVIGRRAQQYPATQAEVLKVYAERPREGFDEERRLTVPRDDWKRCRNESGRKLRWDPNDPKRLSRSSEA